MTLHRVAGLLEGLGRGQVLVQLAVGDTAQVLKPGDLGGVGRRVEEREGFVDAIERRLALRRREIGLCEQSQQSGALALRWDALEPCADLVTHDLPVVPLGRSFRGEAVEGEALFGRKRDVAEEVVEALTEAGSDDLKRPHRRTDEVGLHLGDEALGQLLAGKLCLAHSALAAGAANALPEARCRRRFYGPHAGSSVTELTGRRAFSGRLSCSASVDSREDNEPGPWETNPRTGEWVEGRRI